MKYLLIDTTTAYATVSIIKDDKVIEIFHDQIVSSMASKILPIIDEELSKEHISLKDIDKIFIANGPGSFTGIRVGVTIAKTIAWALSIPVIAISSLELMATTNTTKKYLLPMIDARRGNVFAGVYDSNLNNIQSDKLVNLRNLIDDMDKDCLFLSYDNLDIEGLEIPKIDVIKIINKHKDDIGINPHKLNPNYLKLTEAEESRL